VHALTFDIEDYDELVARDFFGVEIPPSQNVVRLTEAILAELDTHDTRATFFVLGSVADAYPDLVRRIHRDGHELAVHGYGHRYCHQLEPQAFREDVLRSVDAVTNACPAAEIEGYRAPAFSVCVETLWVPEILHEIGLHYESSVFPARTAHFGIPHAPRSPFRHPCGLVEIPMSTIRWFGRSWPVGGGGYLRHLPYAITRRALRRLEAEGLAGVTYLHPYEIDVEPSSLQIESDPIRSGWWAFDSLQHLNRRGCREKLSRILTDFHMGPIRDLAIEASELPVVDLTVTGGRA
jgi:polysaccharide deacetylase family protein (PEP-CTERM system associated)